MSAAAKSGDSITLNVPSDYEIDSPDWYIWTWGGGVSDQWIKGQGGNGSYTFSGVGANAIFCRMKPGTTPGWGNVWNQTSDMTITKGQTYTVTGWGLNVS